jgi:uncharacterized membrane protein
MDMEKWLYRASIILTLIGLAVSIYMTVFKLTGNEKMCIGNGGCSVVNDSPYAVIYGIPVAAFGVGGYLAILAVLIVEKKSNLLKQNATLITFGLTLIGFLFTLYLIYLEIFVIKALCPFCLTSQIAMTILFILSVIRLVQQPLD